MSEKDGSPCLNGSIIKRIELDDISHRKEDSDRVNATDETMYLTIPSRLHKSDSLEENTLAEEMNDVCHAENSESDVLEQSIRSDLQTECSNTFDEDNREKEIPDIIIEINSNSVGNIKCSNSKEEHYSTNSCDSVHISSMPETRLADLHEFIKHGKIPQESQSRICHRSLSSIENSIDANDISATPTKSNNCVAKYLELEKQHFKKDGEENDEFLPNGEERLSLIHIKSPKNLNRVQPDTTAISKFLTDESDKGFNGSESTSSPTLVKYLMKNDVDKFDKLAPNLTKSLNNNESRKINVVNECANIESANGNCLNDLTVINHPYLISVETSETNFAKTPATEGPAIDLNSRVGPGEEANQNSTTAATNGQLDIAACNLEDTENSILKEPLQKNDAMHATLRSHKSRRKLASEKKLAITKLRDELGAIVEHKTTGHCVLASISETRSKGEKTKSRLTRSQRKDRKKVATSEIGVADDDSGIQGDIYEFSEKESNLEDIAIPSIMRRKQETRHTSELASHLQDEMQYSDESNKTEPPVLVPQEPWPPASCTQSQLLSSDGNSQTRENSVDSESLKRWVSTH